MCSSIHLLCLFILSMLNSSVCDYRGQEWIVSQLTDNSIDDQAPTISGHNVA